MKIENSTIQSLEKFISYCSAKNKVISKNIANIGTENYKREDVSFNQIFSENLDQLKTTNDKHIKTVEPKLEDFEVVVDKDKENVSGINNVDIDKEMSELAVNSIQFRFASKKISDFYKNLQNVITGGGKLWRLEIIS